MTGDDWIPVLKIFSEVRTRRGKKGRNDRRFLEALRSGSQPERIQYWNVYVMNPPLYGMTWPTMKSLSGLAR
jgi:hypothetical protein